MRPEPFLSMRAALALGPGYCPPNLFDGPVDAVVRGLKAHANNIAHARHVVMEDSYPRVRALLGDQAFHAIAELHLADPLSVSRSHRLVGAGLANRLTGEVRDLAAVEWAANKAHGAADAEPFDLAAIAGLDALQVAKSVVVRHPATRLVTRSDPGTLSWDHAAIEAPLVLLTRPNAEIVVTGVGAMVGRSLDLLDRPRALADLLELDDDAAITLVTAGGLVLYPEILL